MISVENSILVSQERLIEGYGHGPTLFYARYADQKGEQHFVFAPSSLKDSSEFLAIVHREAKGEQITVLDNGMVDRLGMGILFTSDKLDNIRNQSPFRRLVYVSDHLAALKSYGETRKLAQSVIERPGSRIRVI